MIVAVDPGPTHSAFVQYEPEHKRIQRFGKLLNEELLEWIELDRVPHVDNMTLVIEMIASYGMPVGASVFETCVWIGRFLQAWGSQGGVRALVYRKDVKLNLCGSPRAKDGNVRQALIDRFGGESAIGRKANPGPLYGVSGDVWQALAVAVTYCDAKVITRGGSTAGAIA